MATTGANTLDFQNVLESPDALAGAIYGKWVEWKGARAEREAKWTEVKKYTFATSTRDTTNAKNPWNNTTHRPKLYHIYNNLLVNTDFSLFPNRDWLEFYGYDDESSSVGKRQAALSYLNTKHRLSNFRKVVRDLINDWILYGNCFGTVEYVTEHTIDPVTEEQVVSYVGPKLVRFSPYNVVMNPKAADSQHTPYIIRSHATIGELERAMEENPSLNYDLSVMGDMKSLRNTAHAMMLDGELEDSFIPEGFGSSSHYYCSGHVTLYEFYGDFYDSNTGTLLKNRVITIADGKHILRNEPLNTYSGTPNIFHSVWKQIPDNLWGFGPLENLVGLQYRINHLENSKSDTFDNYIDPDIVIKGDVEETKDGAATRYYVPENGDVSYLRPDTTVLNADFAIQELENAMELYANAPREALGIRTPGEKTAFEVDLLSNAANRGFEYQTEIFSSFLEQLVNAEIEIAVKNLHTADVASVVDDDTGVEEFIRITREDLVSNGKVVPIGARESARKSRIAKQLASFYQTGMADPEVSQHFPASKMAKLWASLLDFEDLYEPYGRIPERLRAASLQSQAEKMLAERQMIDPTGVSEFDPDQEEPPIA